MNSDNAKDYFMSANLTVTIQIDGDGHWGKGATVDEVQRIGGRETVNALENALNTMRCRWRYIKKPEIGMITWVPKPD